jgi:hypothetical protein
MRYLSRNSLGLVGLAALVAVAGALAFAAGGRAASPNICTHPSALDPSTGQLTGASCVTQLVAPHFITAGSDAISVTKFTNESGGAANATHVVITVTFPSAVTLRSVNGVAPAASGCTTSSTSVSCPYGSVSGTVKLTVRFAATTTMLVTGTVTYGEAGNDNPGGPNGGVNDRQVNYDTLTISSNAAGGCFDTVPPTQTGTNGGTQSTAATVGLAADTTLPCTFVDAGVLAKSVSAKHGALNTEVSFVEFPFLPAGTFATVKLLFTPLPAGVNLNKLSLLEDTSYPAPFATSGFFGTFVTVPVCNKDGSIPGTNGTPALGATDALPHSNDSCIFNRSSLPKGGGEIDMHVLGSLFDGHYQG